MLTIKKRLVFIFSILTVLVLSSLASGELQLTINAKLNTYNTDFIIRNIQDANIELNDSYDIPLANLPETYPQFYSTDGSTKLSVDSWNNNISTRKMNLTYLNPGKEPGFLNLSWDLSESGFAADLVDYGYDSTYTTINTTVDMNLNSSYKIDTNGSDRYFELSISYLTINITDCAELDEQYALYIVQNNISADGSCFNITANGIDLDFKGNTLDGGATGLLFGVHITNANNTIIRNGYIHGFGGVDSGAGIRIEDSNNNLVTNMTIISNQFHGIELESADYNTITNNLIKDNIRDGVNMDDSSYNVINSNVIHNNTDDGMSIGTSSLSNIFSNNNITYSPEGIFIMEGSANNTFLNNNIKNNSNWEIVDNTGDSYENYFIYNNSYGEIEWISHNFLKNLTTKGSLTFPGNITISNNSAYLNPEGFTSLIGSGANITLNLQGMDFTNPFILRDGIECDYCYNFTSLNDNIVKFNASSWSNYTIGNMAPVYEITNCEELQSMKYNLSGDYTLMNDIDCEETKTWNDGRGFNPIGVMFSQFNGSLSGNNHTINNLFINRTSELTSGLFGFAGKDIDDGLIPVNSLGLANATIYGGTYTGGIVGLGLGLDIDECFITGTVIGGEGLGATTGGFAGTFFGMINNSYVNANVKSPGSAGGIAGMINKGTSNINTTVSNSYSVGNISADHGAGGIVGTTPLSGNGGNIIDCFTDTNLSGDNMGGVVGEKTSYGSFSLFNVYWNNHENNSDFCYEGGSEIGECVPKYNNSIYFQGDVDNDPPMNSWDFTNTWDEVSDDYPSLQWENRGGEVDAANIENVIELHSINMLVGLEFEIGNEFETKDLNWSLNTDEELIKSDSSFNLAENESILVIVEYNYSSTGDYLVRAITTNGSNPESKDIDVDIEDIEVENISILSQNISVFEIPIKDYLTSNLSKVSWSFDCDDDSTINSTINSTLEPNETIFVFIEYEYSSAGNYYPTATAVNGTLTDSRLGNITI